MKVKVGQATLQVNWHTMVHYYETSLLKQVFKNLRSFVSNVEFNSEFFHFQAQISTIETLLNCIFDTFQYIIVPRPKRGMANFLGRGINWLTGNLDDTDRQRYDKIVE